jgi:hypothetical protein
MMNTLTTPQRLERLNWLIVLCIGYIAARSVFDYARGVNLVEGGRLAGPVRGIFGNPNDLALNMVTFMPAAAIFAMSRHQPVLRRLVAAGIVVLMMATIVFTKSRGGVLGLCVMLLALVVLGTKVRRGFAAIAIASILLATPFMPASFWTRMASMFDEQVDKQQFTGSSEARRIVMQEGINTFLERPFTGVGAGQFKNYNPPGRKERWRETHNALIPHPPGRDRRGRDAQDAEAAQEAPRSGPPQCGHERDRSRHAVRAYRRDDDRVDRLVHVLDVRVGRLQLDLLLPAGAHCRRARADQGPSHRGAGAARAGYEANVRSSGKIFPSNGTRRGLREAQMSKCEIKHHRAAAFFLLTVVIGSTNVA